MILHSDFITCLGYFRLSVCAWGIFLANIRRRLSSRLCFHVFWEARLTDGEGQRVREQSEGQIAELERVRRQREMERGREQSVRESEETERWKGTESRVRESERVERYHRGRERYKDIAERDAEISHREMQRHRWREG